MTPEISQVVTPAPYFKIKFGCSNRAFYNVKGELYDIAEKIGIEIEDAYISEKCDYEGDLEKIIIYNDERSMEFRKEVLSFYKVSLPDGLKQGELDNMNIVLSIF